MPQFGSQTIDVRGTQLIRDWIASLPATGPKTPPADLKSPEKLLTSPSGALQLLAAIDDELLPRKDGQQLTNLIAAVERATVHPDPAIRDLFERFLPPDKRVQRLGTAIKPEAILSLAGDAARGRELFLHAAGVQCKNCHRIGDQGKQLGPDLTQIGKKLDKPKLLESILEPSKTVEPQWVTRLVEANGEVISGLLVEQTPSHVVLRQADGKEVRLAAGDIDRLAPQAKSLMPELLVQDMTAQQVADLLEFLAGLK
jgi:putative heme-binding domain-containing protein